MAKTQFKTILIDPPWDEQGGGKSKRGADRHYPLLKTRDIVPTILGSGMFRPAVNSHLYLWATNNFLKDAMRVIEDLEFRYITCITWAKPKMGLGQYFRGQTEHLLFAVRGEKPGAALAMKQTWMAMHGRKNNLTTLVKAEVGAHSVKPEAAYELIEAASPPARLEMFARRGRQGWSTWGDEVQHEEAQSESVDSDPRP